MAQQRGDAGGPSAVTSVALTATEELDAYEGIRRGDVESFRLVARRTEPMLLRLLGLSTDDRRTARLIVADTWETRLRALGMFTWHTSLTTWIASGVVRRGRALPGRPEGRPPQPSSAAARPTGPDDWSDLPFGPRWQLVLPTLTAAHAGLPLPVREVLHTRHVERWPAQQGCDVLGVTSARYEELSDTGHSVLHAALAAHVGERHDGPVPADRVAPIGTALRLAHGPPQRPPASPDPLTMLAFRSWSRDLDPRLHRVGRQLLSRLPRRTVDGEW